VEVWKAVNLEWHFVHKRNRRRGDFHELGLFKFVVWRGLAWKSGYWKMRAKGWYWKEGGQDDGAVKEG
jgi:hypothetical protein